jgi:hypothetical protein
MIVETYLGPLPSILAARFTHFAVAYQLDDDEISMV